MRRYQLGIPLKTTFFKLTGVALPVSLLISACGISTPFVGGSQEKNSLTGSPGSNGKVLAVKIDDTPPAHPQIGLASADVVYVEQVEGGLTRLAAIFSSKIPENIGPVRSARISDLDILAQYGKVAFAYSGAQTAFRPRIKEANLIDLSAEHEPPTIYFRDPSREAPTNMILNAPALLTKAEKEGAVVETAKSVGWEFGKKPDNGKEIISATVRWPASRYTFTWSTKEERWLISYRDQPNVDSTGFQLGPKTVLIQLVSIVDSEYHDKFGGITPLSKTVGVGFGYLLRDGEVFKVNWKRDTAESGTTFTTTDGKVAYFAPGQIWVALTDKEPDFSLPVPKETAAEKSK